MHDLTENTENKMAPSRRIDHIKEGSIKDQIFGKIPFQAKVPDVFVSLKDDERDFGVYAQVDSCVPNQTFVLGSSGVYFPYPQ